MSARRFSSGTRFRWQGKTYEVVRLLPGGQVNVEDIFTGATLVVEMSALVGALFDGELQFAVEGRQARRDSKDDVSTESEYIDLSDCPDELVAIARYRLAVIRPLLEVEKRTRGVVKARVRQGRAAGLENNGCNGRTLQNTVSVASVYRWIGDYTRSGNDVRSLIPSVHKRGGQGELRLGSEVEAVIESVIRDKYYVRERVTIDDIRDEVAVRVEEENRLRPQHEQLKMPSRKTIARRIDSQDIRQRVESKRGKRAAGRGLSQYGRTEYPTQLLERVEIDHTKSDLIVIDDRDNLPLGRLTLTYCLDMATRYPLGYYLGFEPPSYLAVMECLYHAIRPKEKVREKYGTEHDWLAYGIPSTLVVDNGKEFIGRDLQDACLSLGIVLQQTPVKTPRFKAGVERMYGTLNTMLFHTLPGTTFSNIRERGDYDSTRQACVYLSEVDKMLNIFVVDIYAQQFHRGLGGIPANRWAASIQHGFAPGLPPSAKELSILLGRTAERVIHHYGIELGALRYNSDELVTLRTRLKGKKAKVKYHPADLSCLYVYDPFDKRYLQAPALDQEYTQGLSLWKHRVIRRAVLSEQDRVDIAALGRAKRKIQEIVDQGRRRKRQSTRSRIARWDTAGRPTRQVTEETQAQQAVAQHSETIPKGNGSSPARTDESALLAMGEQSGVEWEISYTLSGRRDLKAEEGEKTGG